MGGVFNLQGMVLFALYVFGIVSAMAVAWVMKRFRDNQPHSPLMMELPAYRWPNLRNLALGLYERAWIFLQRVGTIILTLTILLWFLSTFPSPPEGATGPAIQYSLAGMLGRGLRAHLRADRLQLADLDRAGAGHGGARGGGRRAGHRVRAVGHAATTSPASWRR